MNQSGMAESKTKRKGKRGLYFSYLQNPNVSQAKLPRTASLLEADESMEDDIGVSDGFQFDEEQAIHCNQLKILN